MITDQDLLITQFITLWAVLDPIGHLTLFLGATQSLDARQRRSAALLSVAMAFAILVVFGFGGQYLLHGMGVSLLSFQIAGGIILLLFAIQMVLGDKSHAEAIAPPAKPPADGERQGPAADTASVVDIAVYPLAMPIIAGPGAILTMIVLMDNNRASLTHQFETIAVLAVTMLVLLVTFALGGPISRLIGTGGANLLRRIMGLILSAVAVNLILNAVAQWLKLPEI
ncbi:MarC family protein [Chelatococcus reniformis]|uniref:UPF0056 membrane protein n=1 Tax=Chelatococcus reniformis TaxID=1494448 RepID=A0A916XI13_9HYPH|nr:MarC family protein [Chelatococcus reniformis]GGC73191.1 UPF0056 inner membrane protein [Chelatococcus reniformis]